MAIGLAVFSGLRTWYAGFIYIFAYFLSRLALNTTEMYEIITTMSFFVVIIFLREKVK